MTWQLLQRALALASALSLASCANAMDDARRAVAAVERTESAAIRSLEHVDLEQQQTIAEPLIKAAKFDEARAAAAAYRTRRLKVVAAVRDAGAVTAVAMSLIAAVEQGIKPQADLADLIVSLLRVAEAMRAALAEFGIGKVP